MNPTTASHRALKNSVTTIPITANTIPTATNLVAIVFVSLDGDCLYVMKSVTRKATNSARLIIFNTLIVILLDFNTQNQF